MVALFQIVRRAFEKERLGPEGTVRLRLRETRLDRIPLRTRFNRCGRFKRLRLLAWSGNALHFNAGTDDDGRQWLKCDLSGSADGERLATGAGSVFNRESEISARSDAGSQFVVDQPGEFEYRESFSGGTQVSLVCDPLCVEREHVADHGPGVEQRDREVVVVARGEPVERRLSGA